MEMITYKITGTSPLLMNNPAAMLEPDSEGGLINAIRVYPKEEEAKKRLYHDEKGFYIQAIAFRSAVIQATSGRSLDIPGIKKKEKAIYVIPSCVFLAEEKAYLVDGKDKLIKKYDIDSRRVVIKATKSGIIRHRPRFEEWNCYLSFKVDTLRIDEKIILQLLNEAGEKIGVGDFRPTKKGWFGLFKAELK